VTDLSNVAAVVPVVGEQTLSVEFTTNAKGATRIAVRVYDRDLSVAAERARALYDRLHAHHAANSDHAS
jgi:hypothetical protein